MVLTKSSNPNAIVLGSAKIEITEESPAVTQRAEKKTYELSGLIDMGLARGVTLSFASTKIDMKADNGTVPIKGETDKKATVSFNLLERHLPLVAQAMAGVVTLEIVLAEEKSVQDTHKAGLIFDKLYPLSSFNADGSLPSLIVLKQGITALVLGDDYEIIEASKTFYIRLLASGTYDDAKELAVTYKVPPPPLSRICLKKAPLVLPKILLCDLPTNAKPMTEGL